MEQDSIISNDKIETRLLWLKLAIELHELHIRDPSTATEESQEEMMKYMKNAYNSISPIPINMSDK